MKLRDLFTMINSENKFNEFMSSNGYKEVKELKVDDIAFKDEEITCVNKLVRLVNNEMYGNITNDVEVVNVNGYIRLYFTQYIPEFKSVDGFIKKEIKEQETYLNLYIDTKQVWN